MLSRRKLLIVLTVGSALPAPAFAQQPTGPTMPARTGASNPASKPLKVLSAGSTLYGLRPAAEQFAHVTGAAVTVATDHGHNIRKAVLDGATDADIVLAPSEWIDEMVAAGRADKSTAIDIGAVRIGAA